MIRLKLLGIVGPTTAAALFEIAFFFHHPGPPSATQILARVAIMALSAMIFSPLMIALIEKRRENKGLSSNTPPVPKNSLSRSFTEETLLKVESENPSPELESLRLQLTPREYEIFHLFAHGYGNKEIANALRISVKTVDSHRSRLYMKLALDSRADLIACALQHEVLGARHIPELRSLQPS